MNRYEKEEELKKILQSAGRVLVAFSGGVDSTYLLYVAHQVLGEHAAAVTAVSPAFPQKEQNDAQRYCEENGIEQVFIRTNEMSIEGFDHNPADRCYICKSALFRQIKDLAAKRDVPYIIEGSNVDDDHDYRPGAKALKELGIRSPLKEAGLTKEEIRALSKEAGLSTWDKPSMACLYSRFPYGELITEKKLSMVEAGEQKLKEMGFAQVRVRMHGDIARIEVRKEDFEKLIQQETAEEICGYLSSLGFLYVTMDLAGYSTGSMNKVLQ